MGRHPEALCGGTFPIVTWEKTQFWFARSPGSWVFNPFCSLREDQTTEAHSSWEHLSEHPPAPSPLTQRDQISELAELPCSSRAADKEQKLQKKEKKE